MDEKRDDSESLRYEPSRVSWATAEFVRMPPSLTARLALYLIGLSFITLLIFSFFFQLLETVDGTGSLHFGTPQISIFATRAGIITKLLKTEKQHIGEGEALFEFREKTDSQTTKILSPTSGWITRIFLGEPGEVTAQQNLVAIIPDSSRLTAVMEVPWFESHRIVPGLNTRVWPTGISAGGERLDSTPGKVTGIPFSKSTDGKSYAGPLVSVEINSHTLEKSNLLFEEGMPVRVSIILGRRSLLNQFLDHFFSRSSQKGM